MIFFILPHSIEDEEETADIKTENIIEIINRRKLYKLEAKRAKLEEERKNVSCSSRVSEEEVNQVDVCHKNEEKETEAHQRLRRRDIHYYPDENIQSRTKRRIDEDKDNPKEPDCKDDKLRCETDIPESKHRSDYSVLFKMFGLFVTFSSVGFFMIFK